MVELSNDVIKKILVDQGFITDEQFNDALNRAMKTKKKLIDVVLDKDFISVRNWGQLLAKYLGYSYVFLQEENIEPQVLSVVPELVARNKKIIAFDHGENSIKVAMSDPSDLEMVNLLEKKTGVKVEVFFATPEDIDATLSHYQKNVTEEFNELIKSSQQMAQGQVSDTAVISIVEKLLSYAYQNNASDIHIEPYERKVVVRFRIDGILHLVLDMPKELLEMLVTRIKVLARLKTDEHRAAQDGKIRHTIDNNKVDLRVSIIPITEGEKVVMRLLSDRNRQFTLSQLGLEPADKNKIEKAARKSFGMILVVGPTGSGKTTTLYSVIKTLNSLKVNIATIEDPVEYDIEGVNQIQVNPKTNLTFADGLKSILRQDPDIIMLGEIRDEGTADLAINAALTGHLLLSTLHPNDAATTIPRLAEMNITPYLITSALSVIVAQRLVRKVCVKCRHSYDPTPEELTMLHEQPELTRWLKNNLASPKPFFRGKGCRVCNGKGFIGRAGIFEVLEMTDPIKQAVTENRNAGQIKALAIEQGMTSMIEDGMTKALQGITTVEEIIRAISI